MRKISFLLIACLAVSAVRAGADGESVVRAAWCARDITPEVGTPLAGYGDHDVSVGVRDPLELRVLALARGRESVLLMTYDLLGIDDANVKRIRNRCAEIFGVPSSHVLLSCTHTHGGPHTRAHCVNGKWVLDEAYLEKLIVRSEETVAALRKTASWRECRVGCHSRSVDLNRNRRYTTADNCASFIPHLRELYELPGGIADKELGTIVLLDAVTAKPLYVIGNYAAHPLASHAPGRGGLMITADFPGVYRRTIAEDTGAEAMFINGAAGDVVTINDELGVSGMRDMGERLARASVASMIDIQRNTGRFVMTRPRLGGSVRSFEARVRDCWRGRLGCERKDLEVQCLAIGDVAFAGVPGEIVNELGLEIKWHSPFKRTFVTYLSTGYFGYLVPANFLAAGGYESAGHRCAARDTLRLVNVAADALFALREGIFPEDSAADGERYPDNLKSALINIPGTLKMPKAAKSEGHGVLLLTFDDPNYDRWVEALPLFGKYGAHASFFPNGELDAHALEQLGKLKAAGHTVGIHTMNHGDARAAFAEGRGDAYVADEVRPQLEAYGKIGHAVRSMAYPNNRRSEESDETLSRTCGIRRFRAGHVVRHDPDHRYPKADLVRTDAVFFPASELSAHRVLEGIGIGESYRTDIDEILACVNRAADRDEVLVTFSHDIRPDAKTINMKTEWLERILATARARHMRIIGFDEIP